MTFFNISNLFNRNKTIKDVKVDDLRKERISLEHEERVLQKDMVKQQQDYELYVEDYSAAKNSNDNSQIRFLGRKIRDIDTRKKYIDKKHNMLTSRMRVVNGLVLIKEEEAFLQRIGASTTIGSLDLADLENYVVEATRNGELNQETLGQLAGTMENSLSFSENNDDLDDYLAELDNKIAGNNSTKSASEDVSADIIDQTLNALDQELAKKSTVDAAKSKS